jgi:hypothetical protein
MPYILVYVIVFMNLNCRNIRHSYLQVRNVPTRKKITNTRTHKATISEVSPTPCLTCPVLSHQYILSCVALV